MNYQEQVPTEKKETAIKSLAIVGVIAIFFIVLWVLVQAVRLAPSAFVSLASIADGLYNNGEETLDISSSKSVVNTGEPFMVNWSDLNRNGTYYFAYTCTEGVAAEARDARGEIVLLTCETPFALTGEKRSLELILEAEKRRFTDVEYAITFIRSGDELPTYEKEDLVTVVNASITTGEEVAGATDTTDSDENEDTSESTDDSNETTNAGGATGTTGGVIKTEPVVTTYFPTSNPNGTVDLKVTYLGIGSLNSDNEFTPRGELDNDRTGAIRFEVKNIGTKTSDDWEFEALLPTDPATTYESSKQDALRPNERAVITVGFDNLGDARTEDIEVEVTGGDDDNKNNNGFEWSVEIVN